VEAKTSTVKIFTFKDRLCAEAKPGQFLMLWVPGVDEIPLSIMDAAENGRVSVAVKNVGEATRALHKQVMGEFIGVRGPFGNSFSLKKGQILMVGGGTGIAPLLFLSKRLPQRRTKITFVLGAKTKDELLLMNELERICSPENVVATTEDGSFGLECLATESLGSILSKSKFDTVYTCGPEKMMRRVLASAEEHEIPVEASLERLMRCAIGLCGSCIIGKYRVCRDGPVFNSRQLREVKNEFGISKQNFYGTKTRE
jgi:dihydroorotate dehydrogenase electron transfer subunit